jgi:hypothetical protein
MIGLVLLLAAPTVSDAVVDLEGFLTHEVRSGYQAGTTRFRVLPPATVEKGKLYPVIYVLPVEAREGRRYGDGLVEVKKRGLHRKHAAFFVAPTFSHLPWYADHPTKPEIRQETYFLEVVVPAVDRLYPVSGRHLLGFSKSGWGAFSLLLRHPERFGRAAAWDAPLMMDRPGRYGSGEVFGTAENFERYRVSALLEKRAADLGKGRLILHGRGNFDAQHRDAHALMRRLKIDHDYRDEPLRRHDWHSGWVAGAVEALVGR